MVLSFVVAGVETWISTAGRRAAKALNGDVGRDDRGFDGWRDEGRLDQGDRQKGNERFRAVADGERKVGGAPLAVPRVERGAGMIGVMVPVTAVRATMLVRLAGSVMRLPARMVVRQVVKGQMQRRNRDRPQDERNRHEHRRTTRPERVHSMKLRFQWKSGLPERCLWG